MAAPVHPAVVDDDGCALERRAYTYKSGVVYEGTFRGAKRHGQGLWRHPAGEAYEGQYRDNKHHGCGVYVYGSLGKRYYGEWAAGAMEGRGVYFFDAERQSFYCGGYRSDRKDGEGFFRYDTGLLVVQQWAAGDMLSQRDASPAEAVRCADEIMAVLARVQPHAPTEMGPDPAALPRKRFAFPSGATYDGQHLGAKKHGAGRWCHPDGDSYEGQFAHNRHEGWGVYTCGGSGKRYVGQWAGGVMHGCGVYFFTADESEFFIGQYAADAKHGAGLYHFAESGQSKLQLWHHGELQREADADEATVRQYRDAVAALCRLMAVHAPSYVPVLGAAAADAADEDVTR